MELGALNIKIRCAYYSNNFSYRMNGNYIYRLRAFALFVRLSGLGLVLSLAQP